MYCYNHVISLLYGMSYQACFCLFTVHYGGGVWGVISVGLLSRDVGILYKWNAEAALVNILTQHSVIHSQCYKISVIFVIVWYWKFAIWKNVHLFYSCISQTLVWQITSLVAIIAWTGALCFVMFFLLKKFNLLRVSFEWEVKGSNLPLLISIIYSKFHITIQLIKHTPIGLFL